MTDIRTKIVNVLREHDEVRNIGRLADELVNALSTDAEPVGEPLELPYKNWRGEISTRKIQPIRLEFGATEWHPEPQWLLVATDIEKNAERSFALKDFNPQQPAPAVAVKVKPLDWYKPSLSDTLRRADTVLGIYRVWTHHEAEGKWFWKLDASIQISGEASDEVEARAAAQADYDARILSALSTQVQDVDVVEQAAKIAEDWKCSLRPGSHDRLLGHQDAAKQIAAKIREKLG